MRFQIICCDERETRIKPESKNKCSECELCTTLVIFKIDKNKTETDAGLAGLTRQFIGCFCFQICSVVTR